MRGVSDEEALRETVDANGWIRSPWTGKDVLCSGGVALFYEHVARERMDDMGWRGALGQPGGPRLADWLAGHVRE